MAFEDKAHRLKNLRSRLKTGRTIKYDDEAEKDFQQKRGTKVENVLFFSAIAQVR